MTFPFRDGIRLFTISDGHCRVWFLIFNFQEVTNRKNSTFNQAGSCKTVTLNVSTARFEKASLMPTSLQILAEEWIQDRDQMNHWKERH